MPMTTTCVPASACGGGQRVEWIAERVTKLGITGTQ
jgi:hypothetical protein